MKELTISRNLVVLLDDDDYLRYSGDVWTPLRGHKTVYACRGRREEDGPGPHKVLLHRLVVGAAAGSEVDHRDGNGLNNQKSNLVVCTRTENRGNRGANRRSHSGFLGVAYDKRTERYTANFSRDKKYMKVGVFGTAAEAAHARDEAVRRHSSAARSRYNFPRDGEISALADTVVHLSARSRHEASSASVVMHNNTSGYKGVSWDEAGGLWAAYVKSGATKWRRRFADKEAAAIARDDAAYRLQGPAAFLNFPERYAPKEHSDAIVD